MRETMASLWRRITRTVQGDSHERLEEVASVNEEGYGTAESSTRGSQARSLSDYTELMGGSVPCPSCKGTGKIPKEMEETLVALIPVNDERLQPKHTWRWVVLVVLVCVLIAGGAMFMLVPRAVELSSIRPSIDVVHVTNHQSQPRAQIDFYFMNEVNISNANYYAVEVVNTTAVIISKFQPWNTDIVGKGWNSTSMSISPLAVGAGPIAFNNTVSLVGVVAEYCQAPFSRLTPLYVNMQFDVTVVLMYFNHKEQITLSMVQQVCCLPSGNCTSS